MIIKEISDKRKWEDFVSSNKKSTFLHSWNWGEFNKKMCEKIWRIGIFNNREIAAAMLVVKIKAKRGTFLFIPHGPVIEEKIIKNKREMRLLFEKIFNKLKDIAVSEKADFIRISPILEENCENLEIFKSAGFKNAPVHMMHPELNWILDITKSENEILSGMRKTHRNLIRRAVKENVTIIQRRDEKYVKIFYDILTETANRHKFVPFSYEYIKNEVDCFRKDNQISIFSAEYKNKIISSAIIVFYGKQAFYHHGASLSEYNKIPSSYLNLWEAVKEAKARKKKIFNFYGIVKNKKNHPWVGLSKFKMGFGGYEEKFMHCQDLPMKSGYIINYIIETARKLKRGYY